MGVQLLRGVASKVLPCGCLVGVYETYQGAVVTTIDARGAACPEPQHRTHTMLRDGQETKPVIARVGNDRVGQQRS